MNANYFLFATLEQARPMAHGRMPQERNSIPVLTGTPVAGMVYLDRPKPAGYFIFPDLSVRHEGKYRLSFSLYEETKQPKDADKLQDGAESDPSIEPHVTHRLEVKSEPFQVFSAKKFPGLTESTSLSRMVAEQGCRVRIRRDVRMRRREPKSGSKEWDDYEDESAAQRARASATPDPSVYSQQIQTPHGYMEPISRPRSASNASHHSLGSIARRPSLQEMGPAYSQPHYGTAPHTPQGNYQQAAPYVTQAQQYPSAPYGQQSAMQPPPPQFPSQSYPTPPTGPAQQHNYYSYPPAPPQQPQAPSHHFDSAPQTSRSSMDYSSGAPEYRRASGQLAHPPPPPPPPQSAAAQQPVQLAYPSQAPQPSQAYHQAPSSASSQSYQSIDLYNRPPPMEPRPLSAARLPPLQTAIASNDKLEASSPISAVPTNSYYGNNMSTSQDTHKRTFGKVFSDRHQNGPLRQGARPSLYGADQYSSFSNVDNMSAADDDDNASGELDPTTLGMHYRRADGRQIMRALPGHS